MKNKLNTLIEWADGNHDLVCLGMTFIIVINMAFWAPAVGPLPVLATTAWGMLLMAASVFVIVGAAQIIQDSPESYLLKNSIYPCLRLVAFSIALNALAITFSLKSSNHAVALALSISAALVSLEVAVTAVLAKMAAYRIATQPPDPSIGRGEGTNV